MGRLKIIRQGDSCRPHWYGSYKDTDGWKTIDLRVKIRGQPPASFSLGDKGDPTFEASRSKADETLTDFCKALKEFNDGKGPIPALLKEKELKHASRQSLFSLAAEEEIRLRKLAGTSLDEREERLLDEKCDLRRRVYSRFATFAANHRPSADSLRQLTTALIDDYFADLKAHYSRAETGKHLHLIESAWKRYTPTGMKSPFGDVPELLRKLAKDNPAVARRPLTASEVSALWKTAQSLDELTDSPLKMHPLAVCAAATGMRIGDCCTLRWADIDLTAKPHPLISVKTAKTGSTVTIPVFAELLDVLTDLDRRRDCRDEFVFPAAHAQYARNKDYLFKRGKRLFARALFADADEPQEIDEKPPKTPQEIISVIRKSNRPDERRERLVDVYTRHVVKGESYATIARALGISKGRVSEELNQVEKLTGETIRNGGNTVGGMAALMEKTRQDHAKGGRKSSIYGWHSLRASFCVFAFARGVPEEVIKKIVGHSTVEMTRKYFNPTAKNAADVFAAYMGGALIHDHAPQPAIEAVGARPAIGTDNHAPSATDAPASHLDALTAQLKMLSAADRQALAAALLAQ